MPFPGRRPQPFFGTNFLSINGRLLRRPRKTLGIRVIGIELHEQPYDYERALADASMEATRLVDCAFKYRMATIFAIREFTEAGGLMS
jgi:hypothetical protein